MTIRDRDNAYAPLEGPDVLPLLSWLCFATALASRPIVRVLPASLRPYPYGILAPAALSAAAALVGLLLALLALRGAPRRRGLARLGIVLNAIVLVLTGLAALAMVWILRR